MDDTQVTEDGGIAFNDHMPTYWRVIVTLTVLTAIEFGISFAMHGAAATLFMLGVLALIGLAAWKAVLVARFFMHLRYDPKLLSLIAIVPVILAAPLVLLATYDGIHGPSF